MGCEEYLVDVMIRLMCFHLVFDQPSEDDDADDADWCHFLVYDSHILGQLTNRQSTIVLWLSWLLK